jgi:hypothetical protein
MFVSVHLICVMLIGIIGMIQANLATKVWHLNATNFEELENLLNRGTSGVINMSFGGWNDITDDILAAIDRLIAPRPYLVVQNYPTNLDKRMVIHAYPNEMKGAVAYLRHLGAIHFSADCGKSAMKIPRIVGAGWGSLWAQFSSLWDHGFINRNIIFAPFITKTGSVNDNTIWGLNEWCPDEENKWLCMFLPTTYCLWPFEKTDISKMPDDGQTLMYYHNKVITSESLRNTPEFDSHAVNMTQIYPGGSEFSGFLGATMFDRNYDPRTMKPSPETLKLYAFLMRFNYATRRRMEEIADRARGRSLARLWTDDTSVNNTRNRCAVAHIRRGDRILDGIDAVGHEEYCRQHIVVYQPDGSHQCIDITNGNKSMDCSTLLDLGCLRNARKGIFGALTLNDYMEAIQMISNIRRVFVMTDDVSWLEKQIPLSDPDKKWTFYYIDNRFVKRYDSKSGLYYMTGIKLAQECDVFVGHFGSGVSKQIYEAMCTYHNTIHSYPTFKCPITVDIGRAVFGINHQSSPWGD